MIADKKASHNNFGRLVNYTLDPSKCEAYEVHNITSRQADVIANRMHRVAQQNTRAKTRTYHVSISWAKEDNPTKEQMLKVGKDFLDHMDLQDYQSLVAIHSDTEYDHVHIVANKIHPNTKKAYNGFINEGPDGKRTIVKTEFQRQEEFTAMMEQKYGWQLTPGKYTGLDNELWGQSLSQGQHHSNKKAQELADAVGLDNVSIEAVKDRANEIKDQLFKAESFEQLDNILAAKGLHIEAKGQGAVFREGGGYSVKASDISRQLSGKRLEKRYGQDLKSYCEQRNRSVEKLTPGQTLKAFNNYFEEHVYEEVAEASKIEGAIIADELYTARKYDQELIGFQQQIDQGFNHLYVDADAARKNFVRVLQKQGYNTAMADLIANPQQFGQIADQSAIMSIAEQTNNIDELKGRYSRVITEMSNKQRWAYISTHESNKAMIDNIQQSISGGMKAQAFGALRREIGKSEGGHAMDKGLVTSVHLTKMSKQIAANPETAPMAAGTQILQQMQQLSTSEGGQAVQKILSRSVGNAKLAVTMVTNPGQGSIKAMNRIIQAGINQARQASRGMGMGM